MNKAFRRSLLSLTAASAMASSAFAGNAAYVDVKVNYLNAGILDGKSTVILGIQDDKKEGKQRDRVEILVSLLDKDGDYATKDENGKTLQTIELKRGDKKLGTNNGSSQLGSVALIGNSGAASGGDQHRLYRALEVNKNITRFVLDYSNFAASKLEDVITVSGGSLTKDITIMLSSVDAKGLIVRVTNKSTLKNTSDTKVEGASPNNDDDYLNENFRDINITDDNQLHVQSNNFPTAVAGDMVPIKVYASTVAPKQDVNASTSLATKEAVSGRFTLAPNLEGKIIIVQAVADYKVEGNATVLLNSVELTMKNGVASGKMEIKHALPGSNTDTSDGVEPHTNFTGKKQGSGLGVAFVAYVKDDATIANLDGIDLDNMNTVGIRGDSNDTDVLVVRSGDPAALKVGHMNPGALQASNLWKSTSTNFYLMDTHGVKDYNTTISGDRNSTITLTVVDEYDNPAFVTQPSNEKYIRFEGYNDTDRNSSRTAILPKKPFKIEKALNFQGGTSRLEVNSTGDIINSGALINISTVLDINISDSSDKNGSATETLLINFADTALSSTETVKVKIYTVEPIKSIVGGDPVLADFIDISTATNDGNTTYSPIISGLEPLDGVGSERTKLGIYPEFKAKLRVTVIDRDTNDKNASMTLLLSMQDPEDSGKFATSDYSVKYDSYALANGFGYKLKPDDAGSQITTGANSGNPFKLAEDTFEFNITNKGDTNLSIFRGTILLAKLAFGETSFNAESISKLGDAAVNMVFKAYHGKKPPVYVESYFETEVKKPIGGDDELPVGSILKFKFSGEAVEGDELTIDFNGSNGIDANVILEGEEFNPNDESTRITTVLNADRIVSVVLYESNGTSNKLENDLKNSGLVRYGVKDIKLNGLPVVYKTQQNDTETDERYEVGLSDLFGTNINIASLGVDGAAKIRLKFKDNDDITSGSGDGSEDEKQAPLPKDVVDDIRTFGDTEKPTTTDEEVKTNLYYGFFTDAKIAEVLDTYNNFVNTKETGIDDNFIVECSSGMTCNVDDDDSYIYFKSEAVNTTQTITFKVKDNAKITNSISFSNIRGNAQNTKFNITRDVGHASFNVVNSETIIKIVGDGGKPQEETKLVVVSDNKDAKVKLIPLARASKFFISGVNSRGEGEVGITSLGNYYVLTSDKPGKVTITASGTIKKDDSDTKEEVALSGSGVVNFVAVDLDKPVVSKENVKISSGGLIVTITDANLDIEKTTVEIKGVNDDGKQIAAYSGNNTYTATKLPIGTYQIVIKAYDLAENFQEFEYVRNVKDGVAAQSPAEEVAKALDGKEYSIDGTFEPYDFGGDKHLNWAYHETATDKWYQLLGDKEADKNANPFGWKMAEIDPKNKDADKWYMVKLTGTPGQPDEAGKFGWAMVKSDLSIVKKIAAVKANGSFEYVNVEITAKMAKDKIVFSLAKASK